MAWMSESFKRDKRFLRLQLKRGHVKRKDVVAVLSTLPDVSDKAEIVEIGVISSKKEKPTERAEGED